MKTEKKIKYFLVEVYHETQSVVGEYDWEEDAMNMMHELNDNSNGLSTYYVRRDNAT